MKKGSKKIPVIAVLLSLIVYLFCLSLSDVGYRAD